MRYLILMKTSVAQQERKTAGWKRMGARRPLRGPDAVAYHLVISACARGGQWSDGIRLLQELRDNISPPDVVAYTAAITGCEKAGKWKEVFGLLDKMRKDGVEANEVTVAAVIGACATASANAAIQYSADDEQAQFSKQKGTATLARHEEGSYSGRSQYCRI